MVFSSLVFLFVFLPVTFLLQLIIPNIRCKNALLIVASLLFYAYGEPVFVVLMLISSLINWGLGLLLGRLDRGASAKVCMAAAVVGNLAFLAVFKYAPMFVDTVNALFGLAVPVPNIALPIGISFYTFQALSYVIDVYRGEVKPQRNFFNVLLYISFFPQLIAGPIIKYHDVQEQIDKRVITVEGVASGLRRFIIGLAKKVLIANTMAVTADAVFGASVTEVNIVVAWMGAIAYLIQIYFDFSGYSDMAIGMAKMFGFTYKENFQYPYAATTIKEFWRRWHISLSTWFKEYLYIPLGGNRKGRPRTVFNKFMVFFLCGLWHGAAWTFVVWGIIHGVFQLIEEYVPIRKLPKPLGWIYTMLVVTFAFVLFRADGFDQGLFIWAQMLTGFTFDDQSMAFALAQITPLTIVVFLVSLVAATPIKKKVELALADSTYAGAAQAASYVFAFVLLVFCVLQLSSGGYNPFIYFRF